MLMGVLGGEGLLLLGGGSVEQRLLPELLAGDLGPESWVCHQYWVGFGLACNSGGAVFCEGME